MRFERALLRVGLYVNRLERHFIWLGRRGRAVQRVTDDSIHGPEPEDENRTRFTVPVGRVRARIWTLSVEGELAEIGDDCAGLPKQSDGPVLENCFVGGRSTNCHVNKLVHAAVNAGGTVTVWFLRPPSGREETEAQLIGELDPRWNTQLRPKRGIQPSLSTRRRRSTSDSPS